MDTFAIDEACREIARQAAIRAANAHARNPGNDLVRRMRDAQKGKSDV